MILILHIVVKKYIVNFLDKKIPDHIHLTYSQIQVNLITGSVGLTNVGLDFLERDANTRKAGMRLEAINLKGIGYYQALFGNKISFREIRLLKPIAEYYQSEHQVENDGIVTNDSANERTLSIAQLSIVDGEFRILGKGGDSKVFSVENLNLSLENLILDKETIERKIPFSYGDYDLSSGMIYADLGPYEALTLSGTNIKNKELQLINLSLKSKYNKIVLSRKLNKEHDYIDLEIPELRMVNMDFGFNVDQFFLNSTSLVIQKPKMEIYRDKLVQDDFKQKRLYSRMLREVPFDLNVSTIKINDGYIAYSELVKSGTVPGEIVFADLEAIISNVSNTYENGEKTEIKTMALLMGEAPIELTWNFDTNKENDAFFVSGVVTNFKSESINQFLRSNLRTEAEGDVQELYFTVSGDAMSSSGDMKMNYEDFRFTVLKKDRAGVNKLLTFVGNIFTNDGSKTDKTGYRYGEIYAERDNTKSFFNYLWLNVKDGIVNTLTGNGKKE
ncbi:MAG: hypothetical protein RH981_18775 [Arenibacter sp.]